MRTEPTRKTVEAAPLAIDLPILDSVALRRLIGEVEAPEGGPGHDATLYNRTYHRHNR